MPDDDEFPGRWICRYPTCGQPVEANPHLYLSLTADGSWYIEGVGDEGASVVCTEGHDQQDRVLERSLSAFLEERFPGGTWEGSDPKWSVEEVLDADEG